MANPWNAGEFFAGLKVMTSMDKYKDMSMPFDMKRMAYAGFKVIVSA